MEVRPWLEHTFRQELLLGHSWLRDKDDRKETGVKSEFDKTWALLYHDNGSCLDIYSDRHPSENSTLRVIQAQPLTLSDGQYQIIAHLSRNCTQDLTKRFPGQSLTRLHTIVDVHKYTIRYSSYGPPRDRLCFILEKVDWLGQETEEVLVTPIESLQPLYADEQVAVVLEQLQITRAKADQQRLCPETEQGASELPMANATSQGSSSPQSQRPSTQLPFGTQPAHPIPSRPTSRPSTTNDEPVFLGINRMEPVSIGDVRREDLRSKAPESKQNQLLSLLKKVQQPRGPIPSTDKILPLNANEERHAMPAPSSAIPAEEATLHSQYTRTRTEDRLVANRGTQPSKVRGFSPPPVVEPEDVASMSKNLDDQTGPEDLCQLASNCSWMASVVFNSKSLQVSEEQQKVLNRDESWFKPDVGVLPFQDGNMPIALFTELRKLAEEQVAIESEKDSDDDMDDSSSSGSVPTEPMLDITLDDELPTSPVSWAETPSPEPPERPLRLHQGLPPDSSLEVAARITKTAVAQEEVVPALDIQTKDYIATSLSTEKELNDPPSSLPLPEHLDEDDDMDIEMETSVPQALGEDVVPNARPQENGAVLHRSASPMPNSIVQVRETPYTTRKQNQAIRATSPPRQIQVSSGSSKNISSSSIVYGTSIKQTSSGSPKTSNQQAQGVVLSQNHTSHKLGEAMQGSPVNLKEEGPAHITNAMDLVSPKVQLSPSEERPREQLGPKSGVTKRKIAESPTKVGKRQAKRREIKIVGFGNDSKAHVDLATKLRQEREESLRRFREERNSSKSHGDPKSQTNELNKLGCGDPMEIDSPILESGTRLPYSMSPRHKGLYEDPDEAPVTKVREEEQLPDSSNQTQSVTVFEAFKAAYTEYTGGAKHFGALCKQMFDLELEDKMVPKWQWDDFIMRNRTDYKNYAMDCADQGENPEPYYRFYKDNIRDTLYKKNIVGSKTTLLKALEELGVKLPASLPPVEPQRSLRKNTPSMSSLPNVFKQHGAAGGDIMNDAQLDRTRRSLPSNSSSKLRSTNGTSPHHKNRTPKEPTSHRQSLTSQPTSKLNLLERLSSEQLPSVRSTPERTGDPFRDFAFAFQRSTSFTGATKVDPKKPWPHNLAVRPTIADAPKEGKKVDVLKWSDTL